MFGDPIDNPKTLQLSPLGNHIEVIGGFAFKSTQFQNSGIPVIKIGNINAGFFKSDNLQYWAYDPALERYLLKPGDLVISLTGTVGKDDYGNVCVLGDEFPSYYLNQRNAKIVLKETVVSEYITALLKNKRVKELLTGAGQGVRQANISNRAIMDLIVPVPTIEDQRYFAAFVQQSDKSKFNVQIAIYRADAELRWKKSSNGRYRNIRQWFCI